MGGILATILDKGVESIVVSRAGDGMILAATPGFCEMSGYDHQQVIGHTSVDLDLWADPVERTQMLERLAEAGSATDLDGGLRRRTGEVPSLSHLRADGRFRRRCSHLHRPA